MPKKITFTNLLPIIERNLTTDLYNEFRQTFHELSLHELIKGTVIKFDTDITRKARLDSFVEYIIETVIRYDSEGKKSYVYYEPEYTSIQNIIDSFNSLAVKLRDNTPTPISVVFFNGPNGNLDLNMFTEKKAPTLVVEMKISNTVYFFHFINQNFIDKAIIDGAYITSARCRENKVFGFFDFYTSTFIKHYTAIKIRAQNTERLFNYIEAINNPQDRVADIALYIHANTSGLGDSIGLPYIVPSTLTRNSNSIRNEMNTYRATTGITATPSVPSDPLWDMAERIRRDITSIELSTLQPTITSTTTNLSHGFGRVYGFDNTNTTTTFNIELSIPSDEL